MRLLSRFVVLPMVLLAAAFASAQTAEEMAAKNIEARGGLDKLKAIQTMRISGSLEVQGFKAAIVSEMKRPDKVRQSFTLQGMTEIDAYDGTSAWKISPFQGKKDPELMGEDELRGMQDQADIDGPLVDAAAKGNKMEALGKQSLDGNDVLVLRVTLKNGDQFTYYFDPDTFLETRVDQAIFLRGTARETTTEFGSFKEVQGVLIPFSIQAGPKARADQRQKVTVDKVEMNVPMDDSMFVMPAVKPAAAPAATPAPAAAPAPAPAKTGGVQ